MPVFAVSLFAVVLVAGGAGMSRRPPPPSPPPPPPPEPSQYDREIAPMIAKYCVRCHAGEKPKGDIDLASVDGRRTWKRVWRQIYNGTMPPPGAPAPTSAERTTFAEWIEKTLTGGKPDPGRVVARRLSRTEYRATIRDLTGLDYRPADDFPADDTGYGFDNIGDVLALPPILMERYFEAAGRILDRAILTPEQRAPVTHKFGPNDMQGPGGSRQSDLYVIYAPGDASVEVRVKLEGEYLVRVRASGDQAGDEPCHMALAAGDQRLRQFDVPQQRGDAATFESRVRLKPGRHKVSAAFTNDYYRPEHPDPKKRDRNLVLHAIEFSGPLDVRLPESHARLIVAEPGPARTKRDAARLVISAFAERAWRRPVAADEVERLLALFERSEASFEEAVKLPLRAVLVSPHFLFRAEPDGPRDDPKAVRRLSDVELASRLSYFIWGSTPDEELLRAPLSKPDVLERQVRRMVADPRAAALAESFAAQWLGVRRLDGHVPDAGVFPGFDDDLRRAMAQEPLLFFEAVVREDRSALDLLDANFTFVSERLAQHYGLEGVAGAQMRRVRITDARRGGVMAMAGVLTATSHPTRTSPSRRGKWVLETLLGSPPPPPLPDAGSLKEDAASAKAATLRARLERHRSDAKCAPCHAAIDPIGFGLEPYDAVGAWRERDAGGPIDAAAKLPDGTAFNGPLELRAILLARRDEFVRCLVEKMMTFALGRGLEHYDAPEVRRIGRAAAADGYRMSALVLGIAKSYPFLHRRNRAAEGSDE